MSVLAGLENVGKGLLTGNITAKFHPSCVVMSWKLYHGVLLSLICPNLPREHSGWGRGEEVMAGLPSKDLVILTSLSLGSVNSSLPITMDLAVTVLFC